MECPKVVVIHDLVRQQEGDSIFLLIDFKGEVRDQGIMQPLWYTGLARRGASLFVWHGGTSNASTRFQTN